MTQVQMTDQQLNRALAELIGWKLVYRIDGNETNEGTEYWETDKGFRQVDFWEPTTCQSDSAEVQAKAIEVDARLYAINLAKRLVWDGDGDPLSYSDNDLFSYTGVTVFLTASPRERAEAAYITLQGAKGNE
ncbi:hypothetical protein NST48_12550 [Paenibacillus sp. FSL M7-0547]|uniref:hypothetical protein n=1 Tax=Paenibacillus sp. FSL M7-0547 TaxID=2954755 RepID=UPI0030FCA007